MEDTVAGQFEAITAAARGCDVLVAGMALQFALHSVAEQLGIPYVYAAWCPITLPSPHHAPPPLPSWAQPPTDGTADNRTLWTQDAKRWNDLWAAAINSHRAAAGLAPVSDVRSHIFTDRPWLAADPTLAPWPETADLDGLRALSRCELLCRVAQRRDTCLLHVAQKLDRQMQPVFGRPRDGGRRRVQGRDRFRDRPPFVGRKPDSEEETHG